MYKSILCLKELQNYLAAAPAVAFDFETAPDEKYRNEEKAALDAHKSHIAGISFSVAEGSGMYLPIAHRVGQNAENLTEIWGWLAGFFNDSNITKIAHNLAFESQFLYSRWFVVQEPHYDTMHNGEREKLVTAKMLGRFENEKLVMRVWLIGLGSMGAEYKYLRKIMGKFLGGNSRFGTEIRKKSLW